jgi:hypothetical protein
MMNKHRTVMAYSRTGRTLVEYRQQPDVDERPLDMETVEISLDVYHEMNMPDTITVTVEPGDLLNDGE